jgi:hypothetical protein
LAGSRGGLGARGVSSSSAIGRIWARQGGEERAAAASHPVDPDQCKIEPIQGDIARID